MFFTLTLINFALIIYSADSSQSEISSNETSINITSTEPVTDSSETTFLDVSLNVSTTAGDETTKASSTDGDIEITGHITPSPLSDETDSIEVTSEQNWTTEFYDDTSTTEITTTEIDEIQPVCFSNLCRNGGTCVENATLPFLFSCICPTGYVGTHCETVDKCVADVEENLCKNGACVYSMDGSVRSCLCFPGMYWNETAKECTDPDPPCFPNPCMNEGVCSDVDGVAHCDCPSGYRGENCSILFKCGNCQNGSCILNDEETMLYCKCYKGLYWNDEHEKCEAMMSPCDSNPCQNGGMCDVINDVEFNCSCQMRFSGKTCEITDKCSEDKDCGHGACVLSDDKLFKRCLCHKGFYLEEFYWNSSEPIHTCKEITNVCQPNPCLNDGICLLLSANKYECICLGGYLGKKCEVRDMCYMDGGDAYCGYGNCRNSFEQGMYFCICDEGKYFQYTQRKCVELDMCPLMQCDSMDTCIKGECMCKEHYRRDNETLKCMPDFCSSKPCPLSEMICEEGTGITDYKCYCPEGSSFNGTHCTEAACIFPKLNPCNQHCSIQEDEIECSCSTDFELKEDNQTCFYTGNSTCSNKTCDNGFCVKEDGMEVCICPPGFTEKDGICKDLCSAGSLMPGICPSDECEPTTEGGFKCKCEGKLVLSKDKTTCMVRNICKENEIGWKTCTDRNAACIADLQEWTLNGYKCVCGTGQVVTEGDICRDICSLENNQRQCSIKGATCDVDNKGRMICKCPPYFKANERDGKCSRPAEISYSVTLPLDKSTYLAQSRKKRSLDDSIDYRKISSDVTLTMRNMFTSFTQANILSCKLISEYILCKIELQFTSELEPDLKRIRIKDVCLSNGNSNACLLPPLLVLVKNKIRENVDVQPTNPCDEEIKKEVCGSETTCVSSLSQKSFNCSCKPGFFARRKNYPFGDTMSFIEMCSDIDECAELNPCPANSNCENTIGSYTCSCKPGYRGINYGSGNNNQKCVEICRPNPCTHGHCFRRGDHEFDCRCDAGFAGTFCDLQDEHYKSAKTNTIIVGVVLGGALLITFILFAACISRLRKKKIIESSGHMIYSSTEMTERRRGEGGAVNRAFQKE